MEARAAREPGGRLRFRVRSRAASSLLRPRPGTLLWPRYPPRLGSAWPCLHLSLREPVSGRVRSSSLPRRAFLRALAAPTAWDLAASCRGRAGSLGKGRLNWALSHAEFSRLTGEGMTAGGVPRALRGRSAGKGRRTISEGMAGAGARLGWRSGLEVQVGVRVAGEASAYAQAPKGSEKKKKYRIREGPSEALRGCSSCSGPVGQLGCQNPPRGAAGMLLHAPWAPVADVPLC